MIMDKASLLVLTIGVVCCQGQNLQLPYATSQQPAGSRNPNITTVISDLIPGRLLNSKQKVMKALLEDKCKKYGSPNPFDPGNYVEKISCLSKAFEYLGLQRTNASESKKMFCANTPQLLECTKTFADSLRHCLNADERPYLDKELEGERRRYEYICYNGGERLARFEEEGGMACFEEQKDSLDNCVNNTKGKFWWHHVNTTKLTPDDNLFDTPYARDECAGFLEMRTCVVNALGRCGRRESADFVDTVMDITLTAASCEDEAPGRLRPGAVVGIVVSATVLVAAAVAAAWRWRARSASGRTPEAGGLRS